MFLEISTVELNWLVSYGNNWILRITPDLDFYCRLKFYDFN
jgi:hypothetical protein